MKINKELLQELIDDSCESDRYKVVLNEIYEVSRWSTIYDCVLLDVESGIYYSAVYHDSEDDYPFDDYYEDENGDIELIIEVEPYQEMVTKYRVKKS